MILLDSVILPLPISVNHMYSRLRSGKVFKTKEAKEWEALAVWTLQAALREQSGPGTEPYDGEVEAFYFIHLKNPYSRDFDNQLKAINDAIERAGVITNDKKIMKGTVIKVRAAGDVKAVVSVRTYEG